jgi:hypothetical protein
MPLTKCPYCGRTGEIPADVFGSSIYCNQCKRKFDAVEIVEDDPIRPTPGAPTMPTIARCSRCGKSFEVAERAIGTRVNCPHCKATVEIIMSGSPGRSIVPAPTPAPLALPPEVTGGEIVEVKQSPQPISTMQRCPFCAELVLAAAKKCKHCGEIIDVAMRATADMQRAVQRLEELQAQRAPSQNVVVQTNQEASHRSKASAKSRASSKATAAAVQESGASFEPLKALMGCGVLCALLATCCCMVGLFTNMFGPKVSQTTTKQATPGISSPSKAFTVKTSAK